MTALQNAFQEKSPQKLLALCCWDGLTPVDKAQWEWEISDLVKKSIDKVELTELDDLLTGTHRSGTIYYRHNLALLKRVSITLDQSTDKHNSFKGGIGTSFGLGMKDGKLLIAGLIPMETEYQK